MGRRWLVVVAKEAEEKKLSLLPSLFVHFASSAELRCSVNGCRRHLRDARFLMPILMREGGEGI